MRAVSPDVFGAAERLVIYPFPDCRHPYWSLWQRRNGHCIEARHAVGLGPERDPTRFREGLVDHAEQHLAVIGDGKPLTFGTQAKCMPLRGGLILGDGPLGLPAFSGPSKGESSRN